jgi:hypothetical protein
LAVVRVAKVVEDGSIGVPVVVALRAVGATVDHAKADSERAVGLCEEACGRGVALVAAGTGAGVEDAEPLGGLKGVVVDAGLAVSVFPVAAASSREAEGVIEEVSHCAFRTGISSCGASVKKDIAGHADAPIVEGVILEAG